MTMLQGPVDRKLWLVTIAAIAAIAAIMVVGILVSRGSPSHVASPIAVGLAAAAIVTVCVAVPWFASGRALRP